MTNPTDPTMEQYITGKMREIVKLLDDNRKRQAAIILNHILPLSVDADLKECQHMQILRWDSRLAGW